MVVDCTFAMAIVTHALHLLHHAGAELPDGHLHPPAIAHVAAHGDAGLAAGPAHNRHCCTGPCGSGHPAVSKQLQREQATEMLTGSLGSTHVHSSQRAERQTDSANTTDGTDALSVAGVRGLAGVVNR